MIARYTTTCPLCHRAIIPGHHVHWRKGTTARHTNCANPTPPRHTNTDDGYDKARDDWNEHGGTGRMPMWWATRYDH